MEAFLLTGISNQPSASADAVSRIEIMASLYKCPNWGYCNKSNQIISIATGESANCPECGKKLIPVKRAKTSNNKAYSAWSIMRKIETQIALINSGFQHFLKSGIVTVRSITILGCIVLILLLIGAAAWIFLPDKGSSPSSKNNTQPPHGENVNVQVKSLGSKTKVKVKDVEASQFFIIVKSTKSKVDAIEYAKKLGASGYSSEVILSSTNYYGVVLGRFSLEDAKKAMNAALVSGVISNKPYLMTSARVVDYIYPTDNNPSVANRR